MLTYLTMKEASGALPGNPSPTTVWRWCRQGASVRGKRWRVKLRHVFVGQRMFTSQEWIEEFLMMLTPAEPAGVKRRRRRHQTARERRRSLAEADAILREAGI